MTKNGTKTCYRKKISLNCIDNFFLFEIAITQQKKVLMGLVLTTQVVYMCIFNIDMSITKPKDWDWDLDGD